MHEDIKVANEMTTYTKANDIKSGQWLGSLVASSGSDGTIMVMTFQNNLHLFFCFFAAKDPM